MNANKSNIQVPEIMTIEEVAQYLRVSERTIYEWAQKGDIPSGKLGATWRFMRADIDAWVTRRLRERQLQIPDIDFDKVCNLSRVKILPDVVRKEDCLRLLVDALAAAPSARNREEIWKGILHREKLMSTGIGFGLAVPHARLSSIDELAVAVGVCPRGLADYESLDDKPVKLVFMIVAGANQHAHHIRMLSFISARVKQDTIRRRLEEATDPRVFHDTFLKMP